MNIPNQIAVFHAVGVFSSQSPSQLPEPWAIAIICGYVLVYGFLVYVVASLIWEDVNRWCHRRKQRK